MAHHTFKTNKKDTKKLRASQVSARVHPSRRVLLRNKHRICMTPDGQHLPIRVLKMSAPRAATLLKNGNVAFLFLQRGAIQCDPENARPKDVAMRVARDVPKSSFWTAPRASTQTTEKKLLIPIRPAGWLTGRLGAHEHMKKKNERLLLLLPDLPLCSSPAQKLTWEWVPVNQRLGEGGGGGEGEDGRRGREGGGVRVPTKDLALSVTRMNNRIKMKWKMNNK